MKFLESVLIIFLIILGSVDYAVSKKTDIYLNDPNELKLLNNQNLDSNSSLFNQKTDDYSNRIKNSDKNELNSQNSYYAPFYIKNEPIIKNSTQNNNTIRLPILNSNFFISQYINDGKLTTITSNSIINYSISASYLYDFTKKLKFGIELMHTNYNQSSVININDTFSFMLRSEISLYNKNMFSVYGLAGLGISLNQISLLYKKLSVTKTTNDYSYNQLITIPLINGTSLSTISPTSYCKSVVYQDLNYDNVQKSDNNDAKSVFYGQGAGRCVFNDTTTNTNYDIQYSNYYVPVLTTSIPWFVGIGFDYNLRNIFNYLFSNTDQQSDYGISLSVRYFNNGISRIQHQEEGSEIRQYTIDYKGYLTISAGLYFRL